MAPDLNIKRTNPSGPTGGIFYLKTILLLALSFNSFTVKAQPRLEVTEPKINFGQVKRGDIIRNEYTIINKGDQPLVLTETEISCSCTTAEFSRQPILPGQTTKVILVFNTATVYGRQDRTVLLHSNDPTSPVRLRYKGTVSQKK